MNSIRLFLVATILAMVTLFVFVSSLRGYQSSMQQAEQLFDSHLLITAKLIANIKTSKDNSDLKLNSNIAFQIWDNQQLLAHSSGTPTEAIAKKQPGYDYRNFAGYRWRTLSYFSDQQWIMVAERSDIRFSLAENVVIKSLLPTLIGLPVLGFLIWLIVTHGMRPLRHLATELSSKQADDLKPLSTVVPKQELAQIITSTNGLLLRLEASLEREKQFASDAAHELRTPISSLKIQLHNMAEDFTEYSYDLAQANLITTQLEHVVEQILALYRSSPDHYNAQFCALDLTALTQEIIAEDYSSFDNKEQSIEFYGDRQTIYGDSFSLTTLIHNLLSNANKYTPRGGQILVTISADDNAVVFKVEDSGPGISEEQYQQIFERFYRVGGDRHRSGEPGCGLGLAIVKRIADLYGATIEVGPSSFASGCAFTLRFKAASLASRDTA
ncbi:ATP-binding protein [Porticoccaceae bacterium]|nr:ATP-binding protein [Porticoccaceae bacterium]